MGDEDESRLVNCRLRESIFARKAKIYHERCDTLITVRKLTVLDEKINIFLKSYDTAVNYN